MLQSTILAVLLALGSNTVLATPNENDIPPIVTGVVSSALSLANSYASEYSTIPPDAQSAVSSALSLASSYEGYGNSVANSALSLVSSYASEYGGGGGSDSTTTASVASSTGTGSGSSTGTSSGLGAVTVTQTSGRGEQWQHKPQLPVAHLSVRHHFHLLGRIDDYYGRPGWFD